MSFIDDRSNFKPEPLYDGNYYLVDCLDPIAEFLQVPESVRMHMASESNECSGYDMVDVELTEVVENLTFGNLSSALERHTEELLDEGLDYLRHEAKELGIPEEDLPVHNSAIQRAHADAVMRLGDQMAKILKQFGFYDGHGHLTVDYHGLLPNGLVVFRKSERGFN
jgi:hypothetical protein